MSLPYAVIIAGGEGQRLGGVRKSELRIGGRRQIDRVRDALGAVARPALLASGPAGRATNVPDGWVGVADLAAPCAGPLAGLVAAVARLAQDGVADGLLVSVAVDTPFLPADFVARMREGLGAAPAAFASWSEAFYPPNAIWRIEALQTLSARVARGEGPTSLKALHGQLDAHRVDWAEGGAANPFRNINTVADLVALQRIARL